MRDDINEEILGLAIKTIRHEANALTDLLSHIGDSFTRAVWAMHKSEGKLVITGIGKSADIGRKIVATLNSTGSTAIFLHATEALHGDLGVLHPNDIVLALTKSGETEELKRVWPYLKLRAKTIVSIAADPNSFVAKHSDFFLYTPVTQEADPNNLAPTSSSISQLAMGDAIAMCLQHLGNFKPADFAELHPGGKLGKILTLRVSHLLDREEWPSVFSSDTVREVIYEISKHRLGATAVVSKEHHLQGIITDGDLRRMLQSHKSPLDVNARDIMSANPKSVMNSALAREAVEKMRTEKINHLIVLDEHQEYAGILHIQDLLKHGLM